MKILEVRDGFIKIESEEKQDLFSFLEIKDVENKYIAQIVKINKSDFKYIICAKLLFLYDGSFNPLKGKFPRINATIVDFPFDIIQESFKTIDSIVLGTYLNTTQTLCVSKEDLNCKFLASLDTPIKINKLVTNVAKNLDQSRVLVIDMLGVMNSSVKYRASIDFKLPLNADSLEFIFEDCLTDATSDSKGLIKEIFSDLAEYAKTVDFVPFGTLKSIIDDMVEKSHIFKLLVLKNKLAKFEKEGYFAVAQEDVAGLNRIFNLKSSVLDLSILNSQFQNRYLKLIYSELLKEKFDGQVFVIASNAIDKKNIKNILQNSIVSSAFITHSRFKYLNDFKSLFRNYLLEQTFCNNEIFKAYSVYLNNMPKDKFLLVGEGTNQLPIIVNIEEVEESPFDDVIEIESDEFLEENIEDESELKPILYEVETPLDPHTVAIEKKSEDLIEKISSDVEQPIIETLFADTDEDINDENELEEDIVVDVDDNILNQSFENEKEFHTEVDPVSIESLEDDISESEQEIVDVEYSDVEVNTECNDELEENEKQEVPLEESESVLEEELDEINTEEVIVLDGQNLDSLSEEITSYDEIEYPSELSEIEDFDVVEESVLELDNMDEQITETISDYIETEVDLTEQIDVEIESIVEQDDDIDSDDVVAIDITDPSEEALNKEIIEDVDKVFTTMKEDSLSDSDLDFIDELNDELQDGLNEELNVDTNNAGLESDLVEEIIDEDVSLDAEYEELNECSVEELEDDFVEPLEEFTSSLDDGLMEPKEVLETRPSATPNVPVYEAEIPQEDLVMSDPIEQGDTVKHAKYGVGIVEKMIKYGTKTLYSINFDNVGRRLLDPTLTEIKKA